MKYILLAFSILLASVSIAQEAIKSVNRLTSNPLEYEKTEIEINLSVPFENPYDAKDVKLDMILDSPSGKPLTLPCFFESGDSTNSIWHARFAAQETGIYTYYFQLTSKHGKQEESKEQSFNVVPSGKNGFLHLYNNWTFKFDSGKLFRGLGENVGWESRSFENQKYTYEYLLSSIAKNGANFFRTWMCAWNIPLEWKHVRDTKRYSDSDEYFNPGAIKKMDRLVELTDSLGLYFMLAMDWHGALMKDANWPKNNYNVLNGGPAKTPTDFFTYQTARAKYQNKLRYIIARWGYATSIAAFEFFNEIDNAAYTHQDSVIIPHSAITEWHSEMSRYIKENDPYNHLVTTSISHREIMGLNSLPHIDFNQKHIYKHTEKIPGILRNYSHLYNKPYVVAEFGYRWEDDNPKYGKEFDYDYKRGLWYGLFNPTPILPMTWWWELFDSRNMTPYMNSVREISDQMLSAGDGSFEIVNVSAGNIEAYSVKCGDKIFVYLLNNSREEQLADVNLDINTSWKYRAKSYKPITGKYADIENPGTANNKITVNGIRLGSKDELVLILTKVE
jgi:hypothetical protein